MKTIIKFLTLSILVLNLFSCVKQKFDVPPSNCDSLQNITANKTIAELKEILPAYPDTLKITDDIIISGYVISNDQYGNFYKELVIQDSTAGISIMLDQSYLYTKYPVGQKVIVYCKDLYLGRSAGVIKLGSTYEDAGVIRFGRIQGQTVIDQHLVKTCENNPQEPLEVTIPDIDDSYLYRLIKLSNVQFINTELGTTWANPFVDPPQSVNHTIVDPQANYIIVRTSGYASFAAEEIPEGSGDIVAILGKYYSDYQLYINHPSEVNFEQERFFEPVLITFSDADVNTGGWRNINVSGDVDWEISTQYGNPAPSLVITNYSNGDNTACETWYVSPSLDFSNLDSPVLSFDNAHGYWGDDMEVKISTNWDGDISTIANATWENLSYNTDNSTQFFVWVNSGEIDLSNYKQENVHIAFVYKGTDNDGMTWEIDNIKIYNNQN